MIYQIAVHVDYVDLLVLLIVSVWACKQQGATSSCAPCAGDFELVLDGIVEGQSLSCGMHDRAFTLQGCWNCCLHGDHLSKQSASSQPTMQDNLTTFMLPPEGSLGGHPLGL